MRVLIAGGTGVIGRLIVPRLVEDGHQITVLARNLERAREALPEEVHLVQGDVLDVEQTTRALEVAAPEVVMHQLTDLATGNSAANAHIRVEGTRNLVAAALAAGVERIVAQSIAWCYRPGDGPASEDVPLDEQAQAPDRRTTVAAVKTLEDEVALVPTAVVLRNGVFYGPGTWYWSDGVVAGLVRAGQLPATPGVTSFVHVEDAARAAVEALDWPAGAVNIVDDEPASGLEWTPVFARAVDGPQPPRSDSAQPWERGASNARARRLGWEPRWPTWRSGLATGS